MKTEVPMYMSLEDAMSAAVDAYPADVESAARLCLEFLTHNEDLHRKVRDTLIKKGLMVEARESITSRRKSLFRDYPKPVPGKDDGFARLSAVAAVKSRGLLDYPLTDLRKQLADATVEDLIESAEMHYAKAKGNEAKGKWMESIADLVEKRGG